MRQLLPPSEQRPESPSCKKKLDQVPAARTVFYLDPTNRRSTRRCFVLALFEGLLFQTELAAQESREKDGSWLGFSLSQT